MKTYTCKCGKAVSWGSDSPSRCHGCNSCGTGLWRTDLPLIDGEYPKPIPHEFKKYFNENTGEPYLRCNICMRTEDEINKHKLREVQNE